MTSFTQTVTNSAFSKLQQLTARLLRMHHNGRLHSIPYYKQMSIVKRYNRCLNKMVKTNHPISKAVGLVAIAMLCAIESPAQAPCRQFVTAQKDNPFSLLKLPFRITKPVFVDIDNDGDYDCYCVYPDSLNNTKFAFLRNTGTKYLPLFKLEATGGLPQQTNISFGSEVEGLVFSDIDGDGDYDCFMGNYDNDFYKYKIVYFENTGSKSSPSFIKRTGSGNPLDSVRGFYGLYFNLVDIDADGDYDLYTYDIYYNNFYKNKGTKTNPKFVRVSYESNPYLDAHTIFTDWDKDGLIDFIKTDNFYLPPSADNKYYKNNGTIYKPHFKLDLVNGPLFPQYYNLYSLVDLNNDGFQEAFSYTGTMASTAPVATITTVKTGQTYTLQAYPKGNYTYRWLRNRVKLVNETKDSIKITQPGNYIVQITGNCGTGVSLPSKITMAAAEARALPNEQDALSAINKNVQLNIYPNPFTEECLLKLTKAVTGNVMIYVKDVQGRIMTILHTTNGEIRFGKELKPGTYFIQVMNGEGVIFREKIIKQ